MVNPIPIDRIPEPKNRRNGAGVHYRSDYTASLILGEEVFISILRELKRYLPEPATFSFNRFFTNALITI